MKEARKAEECIIIYNFFFFVPVFGIIISRQYRLIRLLLSQNKVSIRLFWGGNGGGGRERCHLISSGG